MSALKADKKKMPSDYPLLSFRASEEDKIEIEGSIEKLRARLNKNLKEDEKVFKKNSIAIEALKVGLNELLRRRK